jgi:hypothetical protein
MATIQKEKLPSGSTLHDCTRRNNKEEQNYKEISRNYKPKRLPYSNCLRKIHKKEKNVEKALRKEFIEFIKDNTIDVNNRQSS